MLMAVSRVNESVPLFLVEGLKRRLGVAARPQGRGARAHVQARLRRPARLALGQADPAARARAGRRRRATTRTCRAGPEPLEAALDGAEAVVIATNHSESPTRRCSTAAAAPARCSSSIRGTSFGAAQVFARRRVLERRAAVAVSTRPRHRRRRHDRHRGRAPAAARRRTARCASPTSARRRPGCARRARSTPATCATSTRRARRARAAATHVVHLAAIVGGIANFHKLPYTLLEINNALYNALFRAAIERAASSGSCTCRRAWCSSARPSSRPPRSTSRDCPTPRSAYGFSKLAGEYYCRAAHDELGLRYTICARSTPTARARCPSDEPGIAHIVPDLIERALRRERPFPIFGSGEQTRTLTHVDDIADGIVDRDGARRGRERGLQRLGRRGADGARDRARSSGRRAATTPPSSSSSTCPRSRSTCSAAGRRPRRRARLLGWEAQIGVREGIADTVEWLRERELEPRRA